MVKPKQATNSLPDYRLAKAFKFSFNDLASNRLGFMTRTQEWNLPMWAESPVQWFETRLLARSGIIRRPVKYICGEIAFNDSLHDVHGGRFQIDFLALSIKNTDARFKISRAQKASLREGSVYKIYYEPDSQRILSLERIDRCE